MFVRETETFTKILRTLADLGSKAWGIRKKQVFSTFATFI